MIILHCHLQPQFIYELFQINFTSYSLEIVAEIIIMKFDQFFQTLSPQKALEVK